MRVFWAMDFPLHDEVRGGDVSSTRTLVEGLVRRGHYVHSVHPYTERWLPHYIHIVRKGRWFERRMRRTLQHFHADVVVAQNHVFPYAVRAARAEGVPVVLISRDKRYRCPQFPTEYMGCSGRCAFCSGAQGLLPYPWFRYHINLSREMAIATDAQVTVSEHMANDMRAWLPGTDPVVIPPPWDGSENPEPWEPADVLFMGKGHYKGADRVLALAKAMKNRPFRFRVCNDQDQVLKKEFEALPNVDYLGFVDKRTAYRKAKVHIAPARWDEPSSRSVVEAASIGIPSIVTPVGGQAEMVGCGGITVPWDLDEWTEAIDAMMGTLLWPITSMWAMEHVLDYHVEVAAERLEKVLEGVSKRRG